ncbi:F-box protein [Mycetohabitans rhizoxinica]|uniref:F-box protein n=1 Tax=Mycetohabitans rhizoxinica TaxID=412963 RepID=UPI0030CD1676
MDFDLNAALNDYRAYICALESCPQPAASAPPRQPSASRPTTYQDLPPELIERIGDYVPVQDVGNFSAVDRRTYHTMQSRRLVYRYWQQANQVESLESINRILEEMDSALKDPAQHVEPLEALRQRLKKLP